MGRFFKDNKLLTGVAMVLVFAATAELTSRLEDWIRFDVPFSHVPDFDGDLFVTLENGERSGRPGGRYKKFSINSYGFRGPEIEIPKPNSVIQVLLIGSSETFGMYENDGHDLAAQLREQLREHGTFQVVNAALPGMSIGTASRAFEDRFKNLDSDIVVIYVSPLFELNWKPDTSVPISTSKPIEGPKSNVERSVLHSRFLDKLKDAVEKPELLQRMIDAKELARRRSKLSETDLFSEVPQAIVAQYIASLESLVNSVRESGAEAILMTHALRTGLTPSSNELRMIESFIKHTPRATPSILVEYESAIRERMIDLANRDQLPMVDLAKLLNGQHEAFGDLVHFTDKGAAVAAAALTNEIVRLAPSIIRKTD